MSSIIRSTLRQSGDWKPGTKAGEKRESTRRKVVRIARKAARLKARVDEVREGLN